MWFNIFLVLFLVEASFSAGDDVDIIGLPPAIVEQPPGGDFFFHNESFVLPCDATGNPPPSFRWTKNGKTFHLEQNNVGIQSEKGSLIFSQAGDSDQGAYRCFVKNSLGIATTDIVNVRRVKPDEIVNEGESVIEANEWDSLIVPPCTQCGAFLNDWHVEWVIEQNGLERQLDGSRVSFNDEGSLFYSYVHHFDRGDGLRFVNVLRHKKLMEISREVKRIKLQIKKRDVVPLRTPEPLHLTSANLLVNRSESLRLSCIYSGVPVPQVTWIKDGSKIVPNDHITPNGPHLIIKNVTFDDQGLYTCTIITNEAAREVSHSIFVTVAIAPYFISELEDIVLEYGAHHFFKCDVLGMPEPQFEWFFNGAPYSDNEMFRKIISSGYFLLRSAARRDTGIYGCNASNALGHAYKEFHVTVQEIAPRLLRKSQNMKVFEGSPVNLHCDFYGIPQPTNSWHKRGAEHYWYQLANDDRHEQNGKGNLKIHNVSLIDSGSYKCLATNPHGSISSTLKLTVLKPTQILGEMVHYDVPDGENVTIGCDVKSDPNLEVEVKWHKFNDILSGPRFVHNPDDNSFTITSFTDSDVGVYMCSASTKHDEVVSDRAIVRRMYEPKLPKLTLESCKLSLATFSMQSQGDNVSPIKHYRIEYNTLQEPENWRVAIAKLKPTDLHFQVDLARGTKYSWRAIAMNEWGDSKPSHLTQNCSTFTRVPNLRTEGATPGTLTISWDPLTEEERNGSDFGYVLHWRNHKTGEDWNTDLVHDWRNTSITLRDLPIYEKYWIKVTVENEVGASADNANEIIGYSGESDQIHAPDGLEIIKRISDHEVLFRWSSNPPFRARITKFTIRAWNRDDLDLNVIETPPFVTTAVVSGLKP